MDHENVIDCLVPACQLNVLFFFLFFLFFVAQIRAAKILNTFTLLLNRSFILSGLILKVHLLFYFHITVDDSYIFNTSD